MAKKNINPDKNANLRFVATSVDTSKGKSSAKHKANVKALNQLVKGKK